MRLQLGRTPRAIEQRLRTEWARFPGASNDATRRRQPAPVRRRRPPRYRPRPRRTSGRHGRRTRRLASPCVPRRARRSPPVRRRPGLRRRRCRQRSRPPLRRVVAKCPRESVPGVVHAVAVGVRPLGGVLGKRVGVGSTALSSTSCHSDCRPGDSAEDAAPSSTVGAACACGCSAGSAPTSSCASFRPRANSTTSSTAANPTAT